ncbi:Rsd/AlgQ family anti-sigma factor [Candidatus Fukatsuia symbiotica]|uniref:Regulator of sigma D n=1 Tax=Candidatus Fukatsuia symbiotica TaxID=1878942 RepID=A0A2U8I6G5_9GAMM|nr:Rsd/AlgQ family anti-sigma factor [Candidatus Fukatsuia symbiotica]AWK14771.1 Rsd/AlgQ family anti-sigma factor [Candidatus Fukatsuia symbiotica]MEA9445103.1 Rsd/AlgQ family anti-sigma factor [Candidatus Fukatsuia symbiotica]
MLNRLENLTQRVGGSNELIDQWLQARKKLLVTYCTVIGVKQPKAEHASFDKKALEDFFQNLMDYLSSGHFKIYDTIIEQTEGQSSPKMALKSKIYPALKDNTQDIMEFHDNYIDTNVDQDRYLEFNQTLSALGQALDTRFQLEDQLIQWAVESWQTIVQERCADT